MYQTDDKL